MSDYTPSTERVRDTWTNAMSEGCASAEEIADAQWDTERRDAQFDRWLVDHDAEVRAAALSVGSGEPYQHLAEKPAPMQLVDERDPECVKAWPECASMEYDPACCRFPKSCSAGQIRLVPVKQEGDPS